MAKRWATRVVIMGARVAAVEQVCVVDKPMLTAVGIVPGGVGTGVPPVAGAGAEEAAPLVEVIRKLLI